MSESKSNSNSNSKSKSRSKSGLSATVSSSDLPSSRGKSAAAGGGGGGGGGSGASDEENVRVVVRCRPLSRKEVERQCKQIADVDSAQNSIVVHGGADSEPKSFTFDSVFPPNSTQADVYNDVARPIVENVLQGYNGTIFAYGQTGTGKTYTMEGVYSIPELKGIIPNSFAQIFTHIAKAEGDQRFLVRCSYLEIYNEDVRDLLAKDTNTRLEVKEHKDKGVYVKDLSTFVVRNADDMDRIMGIGNRNRSVASTNMNSVSSRSHAIFTIMVECSMEHKIEDQDTSTSTSTGKDTDGRINGRSFRMGKLNLVDLAGSERLSKTQATGDRLKEATKINLSLSNLGNVISALVDGNSHVPYRNSKLTRLLQDSLGGNSKTVMVANVGPADYNYDETVSTLRFANRAKNIKNHAVINEDPKDALLRQFEKQIQDLRRQLEEELAAAERGEGVGVGRPEIEEDGSDGDLDLDLEGGLDHLVVMGGGGGGGGGEEQETLQEIKDLKDELESHAMLSDTIGSATVDRRTVITALQERVMTWKETEAQKANLQQKLKKLQKKILVGGENLLDKSQAQEELLLRSMNELSLRQEEEVQLQEHLKQQEEDRKTLESRILSCQDQNLSVTKKLKKVWNTYQVEKSELGQIRLECQEETDALVDEVHKLSRELQLHNVLIDNFIPPVYQGLIEKSVKWQADSAEWTLKCVAYAGNNMNRSLDLDLDGDANANAKAATNGVTATMGESKIGVAGTGSRLQAHLNCMDLSSFYLDISDQCCFLDQDQEGSPGPGTDVRERDRERDRDNYDQDSESHSHLPLNSPDSDSNPNSASAQSPRQKSVSGRQRPSSAVQPRASPSSRPGTSLGGPQGQGQRQMTATPRLGFN